MMIQSQEKMTIGGKRILALGLLLAALMALCLLAASSPAHASTTFTVNTSLDGAIDGACDAVCTLREALVAANNTPNSPGSPDLIRFNIPGSGVHTIKPSSALPTITEEVIIDGYTQPGASPNTLAKGTNAKLTIELDGSGASGALLDGLVVQDSNTVVRGLVINRFGDTGIVISGTSTTGVRVEGNFIGTDPSGTLDAGNELAGVLVTGDGSGSTVGGTTPEKRNLISGNAFGGVVIVESSANKILGNLIGTEKDGASALGNGSDGVSIGSSANNFIGGTTSGLSNIIAFNRGDGVQVLGESPGNSVLRNSIFSNDELSIDLILNRNEGDGPTPNDVGDADVGANGLQNKPTIRSAVTSGGVTTIKGKLSTKPNNTFMVRFFSNPSGTDEGKTFIGQKKVSTDSDGKASFTFTPTTAVGVGKTVTATATGPEGTSEFSTPKTVTRP